MSLWLYKEKLLELSRWLITLFAQGPQVAIRIAIIGLIFRAVLDLYVKFLGDNKVKVRQALTGPVRSPAAARAGGGRIWTPALSDQGRSY